VWRHLARGDLDADGWSAILRAILDRQGRLGNDSEVCWALYACMRLAIPVPEAIAQNILKSCGALSIVALLNGDELGLVAPDLFEEGQELLSLETAAGPYWPVLLEWKSRAWPNRHKLSLKHDVIDSMSRQAVVLFDPQRLPPVFDGVLELDFASVPRAI